MKHWLALNPAGTIRLLFSSWSVDIERNIKTPSGCSGGQSVQSGPPTTTLSDSERYYTSSWNFTDNPQRFFFVFIIQWTPFECDQFRDDENRPINRALDVSLSLSHFFYLFRAPIKRSAPFWLNNIQRRFVIAFRQWQTSDQWGYI